MERPSTGAGGPTAGADGRRRNRGKRRPRALAAGAALLLAAPALAQETARISETALGGQAWDESSWASLSADGRHVAFNSAWDGFALADANGEYDVFVKDRATGAVEWISRAADGGAGNAGSSTPSISANGRHVAFSSMASNLAPLDFNGTSDIFVHDRWTGTTERITDALGLDLAANGSSYQPVISADGRFVAYTSLASNLVVGDANATQDVFLHDRIAGTTVRVSLNGIGGDANGGSSAPSISANGRFVAFQSAATNLVAADTNGQMDVFVHDAELGGTERVSVFGAGIQLGGGSHEPSISGDGQRVAFSTTASLGLGIDFNGTFDIAVRDRASATLIPISLTPGGTTGNGPCGRPALSGDGRYVAYDSTADDLVALDTNGGTDVFRARVSAVALGTRRMSVASDGSETFGGSTKPAITEAGQQVAFQSFANDLISGDVGFQDVFVRNLGPDFPAIFCQGKVASNGCVPEMSFAGVPRVSGSEPFHVLGHNFAQGEHGLLVYGTNGRGNLDFHGGKLCVKAPFQRWLPVKQASLIGVTLCSGTLSRNFNARIRSGTDPVLTAGQVVQAQWVARDPGDPFGDALADGLEFTIGN